MSGLPVCVRLHEVASDRDAALVEAVLDALPSPTVLLDADGTVLLTNPA
jgi:transcriptional regulator of aromatic amino acid metabolism